MPPVGFQLAFARAAGTDSSAEPREGGALSGQPGKPVFLLRQLHLQTSLGRTGALGKDVKDEGGPVDHPHAKRLFDIGGLTAGQLNVEDDQLDSKVFAGQFGFGQASRADAGRRVRGIPPLNHRRGDLGAGGIRQLRKLAEGGFRVVFAGINGDQQRADPRRRIMILL